MISIKLSYQGELRRAAISRSCFTYDSLNNFARRLFPVLNNERKFSFSWIDDDGDKITMSSNEELLEALRIGCGDNSGLLRFEVNRSDDDDDAYSCDAPKISPEPAATNSASSVLHKGVRCDECNISPIVGIRYKCTVRQDYDLCESCEAKRVQPYPMIKCYAPFYGHIPGYFSHPKPPFHGAHHFPPPPPAHEFNSYDNPMHGPVGGHHAPWHHHRHGPRPGRCHGRGFGRGFRPCRDVPPRECPFRHEPFEEMKPQCKAFNVQDFIDAEALKKFCTDALASSKSVDTEALKNKLSEMISKVLDRIMQFRNPSSTTPSQHQQPAVSMVSDEERIMFEAAVRESMEELERSNTLSSTTTSTDTSSSTTYNHITNGYGTEESKSAEETGNPSEIELTESAVSSLDSATYPIASATTSLATATAVASLVTDDTRSTTSSTNGSMEFQLPLDWEFVNVHRSSSSSPPTPPYNQSTNMSYASTNSVPADTVPVPSPSAPPAVPVAVPPNDMEIWREELRILADMGFVDPVSVIPLLNEHAFPAFSQQPAESASIKEEGIQRVVNVLLSGI